MQLPLFNASQPHNLLPENGEAYLFPNFLTALEATHCFQSFQNEIAWKQEAITMFGKKVMQPRLTALYGDANVSYTYSGTTMHPILWTPSLLKLKAKAETVAGTHFTTALLNFYRDGKDSMGWHRDNEKSLGENPLIASLSLGAERVFCLRNYAQKKPTIKIKLTHGSLLIMKGSCQHDWEHALPKTKSASARINITFRTILQSTI